MKKALSRIFTTIGFSLILVGLIFSSFPSNIYAADLELIGKDIGLVVEPANERLFNLTNLNPGDTKTAKLTIKNNYKDPFNLYMRAERIGEVPVDEADLFNILILTVTLRGTIIYEGPIKDFATSNIALGRFNTGNNEELIATIHLSGPKTGNEYQGKSVDVKWIFIAESIKPPEHGGFIPDDSDEPLKPPVVIYEEEVPTGKPKVPATPIEEPEIPIEEPEDPIEKIDENIPKGSITLPKTGELPLSLFYTAGGTMILLGLGLGFKRKSK